LGWASKPLTSVTPTEALARHLGCIEDTDILSPPQRLFYICVSNTLIQTNCRHAPKISCGVGFDASRFWLFSIAFKKV
jgi:hypothetical protein